MLGKETIVDLRKVASVMHENESMALTVRGQGVLVFHMDSVEMAQTWTRGLEELLEGGSVPRARDPRRDNGVAVATKELRCALEARALELETLNSQKEQQIMACQNQFESSLATLQDAQHLYIEQQKVLNAQQETIHALVSNADQGTAGKRSANNTRDTPAETTTLSRPNRQGHKADVMALLGEDPQQQLSGPAAMAHNLAMQAAPGLLEALQSLTAEKNRLQAELDDDQISVEDQLRDLQKQMDALEAEEAAERTQDAD